MSTMSSEYLGDTQQRSSGGKEDKGYISILQRRRGHYSHADEATENASRQH